MEKFMLPYGQEKMTVEIEKEHLAAVLGPGRRSGNL